MHFPATTYRRNSNRSNAGPSESLPAGSRCSPKCDRVGAEDDVAELGQGDAGVVHRVAAEPGRLDLADVPSAGVFVPQTDPRAPGISR